MQRKCLKCGHVNATASGDNMEACPSCEAIYSRVEAAFAARAAGERPISARSSSPPSTFGSSRITQRSGDVDVHAFAEVLRSESLYPTFRSLVKLFYWFFIALAVLCGISTLVLLFTGSGVGRIGGVIAGVFMTLFFVLIAKLTSETSLMLADLSDAAVRIAAKP